MFYIAVGEAFRSKFMGSPRNVLNSKDIVLHSGPLAPAAHFHIGDYCQPDGAAVEVRAGGRADLMAVFTG